LKKPHWPKRLTTGKRSCPGTSKTGKLYDFSDSAVDLTVTPEYHIPLPLATIMAKKKLPRKDAGQLRHA
jgi:hypothetical protein